MPKSNFIPASDHDFLVWFDHFVSNLTQDSGVSEADLNALKEANKNVNDKAIHASDTVALAKKATADKNDSRQSAEAIIRAEVRRIKARTDYTEGLGAQLGIIGPEHLFDIATAHPDLSGIDQTGGLVSLSFTKYKSDGINVYCQRENDVDWVWIGRATLSPYLDNRPLLVTGKPELRRYTAIYMLKDKEISQFSDDIVVNCAP